MSAASEQLSTVAPTAGLSERDREIIAFERQWWKYAGSKETAIKELFDMSLDALLPGAQRPDRPTRRPSSTTRCSIKRLRRLRASRQRARSARRLGLEP